MSARPDVTGLCAAFIGLFAGVLLTAFPLGLAIKHKDRQIAALADFANQILEKTASAMEVCVAQRDAARIRSEPQQ